MVPGETLWVGMGAASNLAGLLVLAAFVVLLALGAFVLVPRQQPAFFAAYAVILCAGLIAVCYVKGEPPRRRWGKR